jgi:hypothetical protein
MLHTGDIHLSKPEEFDNVDQILKNADTREVFYVPGEHDMLDDGNGKSDLEPYGKNAKGAGWYSYDKKGAHFIGLVNLVNLKAGGLGSPGPEQPERMEDDVQHLKRNRPIVVFAHIPLWSLYPEWGWGTEAWKHGLAATHQRPVIHEAIVQQMASRSDRCSARRPDRPRSRGTKVITRYQTTNGDQAGYNCRLHGTYFWHKTWSLRHSIAAGRGRDGRSVYRARCAAEPRGRDQDSSGIFLDGS